MKRFVGVVAGMFVAVAAHAAEDIIILDVMPLFEFFVLAGRKLLGVL